MSARLDGSRFVLIERSIEWENQPETGDMTLTRRQQEILERLYAHAEAGEPPPSLDALCTMLGVRSRGSLHRHIQALVEAGRVEPLRGQHRGIRLVPQPASDDRLPLLGRIAAGRPIEAIAEPEQIEVPSLLRTSGTCYASYSNTNICFSY